MLDAREHQGAAAALFLDDRGDARPLFDRVADADRLCEVEGPSRPHAREARKARQQSLGRAATVGRELRSARHSVEMQPMPGVRQRTAGCERSILPIERGRQTIGGAAVESFGEDLLPADVGVR